MSTCQIRGQDAAIYLYDQDDFQLQPTVPAAIRSYFVTNDVAAQQNRIVTNTLTAARTRTRPVSGNINASGTHAVEINADSMPHLLYHTIGGSIVTTGTDPYTHVLEPGALPVGFMLEKDFGAGITGSGRVERIIGCHVDNMTLNFPTEGICTANFGIVGSQQTLASTALDSSAEDNGHTGYSIFDATVIEEGGASIATVTQATINYTNNHDANVYAIGGAGKRACLPEGFADISGSITAIFRDATLLTKAVSNTASSLKIKLSRGDGLGSAGNESIEFFVNALDYNRTSVPINTPAGLLITLPFTAYQSGSDLGFKVTVKNALANLYAA